MNHSRSLVFLFSFLLVLSANSFPQKTLTQDINSRQGRLTGVILDSLTRKPVQFANFVLYRFKDSVLVQGAVTDKDGKFIADVPFGYYSARISFIGYKTRRKNQIAVNPRNSNISLDTILLSPKSFSTAEVNVVAEKELVTKEEDKIILKVNKGTGNNAIEVLENSPMINVDIDGKIKLLGRDNAEVYVNGHPMKYSGYDKVEDLKMMTISEIEKIELIPDPSLEFETSPEGGIINIITKKESSEKYNGTLGFNANTRNNLGSNASLGYSYKNLSLRGRYYNGYTSLNTESNSLKSITLNNNTSYLTQKGLSDNNYNTNSFGLTLNLKAGVNSSLFAQAGFRRTFTDNSRYLTNFLSINESASSETYESSNKTHNQQKFFDASAMYNMTFEKKGRALSVYLSYMNNAMNMNNNLIQNNLSASTITDGSYGLQKNTSGNTNRTLNWGFSYGDIFFENVKFKAGYRGNFIKLSMDNSYTSMDKITQTYIEDEKKKLLQRTEDTRHSLFSMMDGNFWNFRYSLGFSFEKKIQLSEEKVSNNNYRYEFSNIAPNILLSRKLFEKQEASFRYIRMYNYPQNRQLNPHIDYTDSTNLVMGNPDLEPGYFDNYSLRYSFPVGDQDIFLGFSYFENKNIIEQVTSQINTKTSLTTYRNVSSLNSMGASISTGRTLFNLLRLDYSFSFFKSKYNSPTINNDKYRWFTNLISALNLKDYRFMLFFNYSSPSVSLQEKSRPVYFVNASVKALFFNKALSLTLRADDLFNTRNLNSDRYGTGFYSVNNIRQTTRIVSLDVSYFFQGQADDYMPDAGDREEYGDDF